MSDEPRYATLRDYLRVLREQRLLILVVTLVFGGIAFGLSIREDPVYRAQASVSIKDPNQDPATLGITTDPVADPQLRLSLVAGLVGDPGVVSGARTALKVRTPPGELRGGVSAFPQARTNLLVVQAQWGNKEFAARLANAFADQIKLSLQRSTRRRYRVASENLRDQLRKLGNRVSDQVPRSTLIQRIGALDALARLAQPAQVVATASPPDSPESPRPVRNTLLGLLVGLTLGLLAAFVRDSLDRRLRGIGEIRDELHLPLLGHVRNDALGRTALARNGRAPLTESDLESFRILRTNLEFLDVDREVKVVAVTSGLPEEGKSTVATSLATAFAIAGRRTLLVECDLRRPTLAERASFDGRPGLSDFLADRAGPADVLRTVPLPAAGDGSAASPEAATPGLVCIPAGSITPRPAEMLGSQRMARFLTQVREVYDVIVLDTAPLLSVVDTLELLPQADAVLMCVRASQTTREQAKAAHAALQRLPEKPTGLVVTGLKPSDELDYGYYSYAYAYGTKAKA